MVKSYEPELIIDALKACNGKVAEAARYLQSTQRILHYRIKNLGIDPSRYRV